MSIKEVKAQYRIFKQKKIYAHKATLKAKKELVKLNKMVAKMHRVDRMLHSEVLQPMIETMKTHSQW